VVSLIVKLGALIFVLSLDRQNAINFQLLGGIWILQTFPSIVSACTTRWFHRWRCSPAGRRMIYGTIAAYQQSSVATKHFGSSLDEIPGLGNKGYIALTAFALNVLVAVVLTIALRAGKAPEGVDATKPTTTTPTRRSAGGTTAGADRPVTYPMRG